MKELDDITMKKAAKGESRAFGRLYEHYAPFLWRVIFRTVNGDRHAASEIIQDTFVRISRSLRGFNNGSAFSTWAYRIAYNAAQTHLKHRRRKWRREREFDETAFHSEAGDRYETRNEVERLLAPLSSEERFLLTAHAQGVSFEELAGMVNKSPGAVRVQTHRIRERGRKEVEHGDQ